MPLWTSVPRGLRTSRPETVGRMRGRGRRLARAGSDRRAGAVPYSVPFGLGAGVEAGSSSLDTRDRPSSISSSSCPQVLREGFLFLRTQGGHRAIVLLEQGLLALGIGSQRLEGGTFVQKPAEPTEEREDMRLAHTGPPRSLDRAEREAAITPGRQSGVTDPPCNALVGELPGEDRARFAEEVRGGAL